METIIRDATPNDLFYIDNLRKKNSSELGFIPLKTYESITRKSPVDGRFRHLYSRLLVTEDNTDLTGFCYASFAQMKAHIFQICIQEDARRWHRALLMADLVENEAKKRGNHFVTCRVAYDLESNFFWQGIGYSIVEETISTWLNQKESKSKRPILVYEKQIMESLFDLTPYTQDLSI